MKDNKKFTEQIEYKKKKPHNNNYYNNIITNFTMTKKSATNSITTKRIFL